jgi:fatty acid desaturase
MQKYPIPTLLNVFIICVSTISAITLLVVASRSHHISIILLCAIVFSLVNNTNFSLLHEAVHDVLHRNAKVNYVLGVFLAAFFPTGFTFQRYCHLGHHQRNRSYAEQFDYYRPTDNRVLRYLQWYGILTGLYWCLAPFTTLVYLIAPKSMIKIINKADHSQLATTTGSDAMLKSIGKAPMLQVRCEILFTLLFQISLFLLLGVTWQAWLVCYAAFAINWSSLQYADHAWSELDTVNGAWNLRINPLVRVLFLNYHHHRAHHQNPRISWRHLHSLIDYSKPRPSFLRIYLMMWKGPRPITEHETMHNKVLTKCC